MNQFPPNLALTPRSPQCNGTTWVFPFYCELLVSVKVKTLFLVGDRFPLFYLPAYAKEEEKNQGSLEKALGHSGYQPVRLA